MQPDIYIGTLRLSEPVIALTGLLIAGTCGVAWLRLRRLPGKTAAQHWVQHFFLLMGLSAFTGALGGHLFFYAAGVPGKLLSWALSIFSLGALAQAAIKHWKQYRPGHNIVWLSYLNLALVLAAVLIAGIQQNFHWVEVHSAVALLGIMAPIEALLYARHRAPGSRQLLLSLPVAVLAVLPHLIKWSPSIWFTYFDVGHIILCGSLWLILRGAESLAPIQA